MDIRTPMTLKSTLAAAVVAALLGVSPALADDTEVAQAMEADMVFQ